MVVKTAIMNLTNNNVSRETLLPIVMTKQGDTNIQSLIKDLSIDSQIKEAWSLLNNTNAPVLKIAELDKEILVCIDASKKGLGGVLMQEGQVVCYSLSKLNEHE